MTQLKTRPRKTVDDYMKLPEGTLAELIEGEIVGSPSPKLRHQRIVGNLYRLLIQQVEGKALGRVLLAPMDVYLRTGDIFQPDVLVVLAANSAILKDWVRGAPDLVVEVVSPDNSVRDRFVKRERYALGGVTEYWIVDDESKSVEVLRLRGTKYEPAGYFEVAESVVSSLLSTLSLSVRDVFAE